MSGLAALLAGHNPPDLYQWHSAAHVPDVEHAVVHADWRFAYLDGWAVEDEASFLKSTTAAFELPDPAAQDLGSLSDALNEVECGEHKGVVLLWDGWSPFARHAEQAFGDALRVLRGRAHVDTACKFAVLLRGEGPTLDLPELPAKHI